MKNLDRFGDTINAILAKSQSDRGQNLSHVLSQQYTFNSATIFKENDENGFFKKELFSEYLLSLDKTTLFNLGKFFEFISTNQKFRVPLMSRIDRSGREYYWVESGGRMLDRGGFKLFAFDGLEKLLTAYDYRQYAFQLDLTSLFKECQPAEPEGAS